MATGARSFAIKSGFCSLYPDRIEIREEGFTGAVYRWFSQRGIHRMSVLYLLLSLILAGSALVALSIQNFALGAFLGLAAPLSIIASISGRKTSFAPIISREAVDRVEYIAAVKGVSRGRFDIFYRRGKARLKRKVLLPTSSAKGEMMTQAALLMMREEGLIPKA